jgi:hypothetical protein
MFKRSLGISAQGVERTFHHDPDTDTSYIEYTQDVEPIIERNKRETIEKDHWKDLVKDDLGKYATVPVVVQYQWIKEFGTDPLADGNEGLLFKLLNSRDYRYLKCTEKIYIPPGAKTS